MGLTGDFGGLQDLVTQLHDLTSDQFRRAVNLRLREAARTLLAQGFEESVAPDGSPWAPLKRRDGQPLLDTGRLRSSFGFGPADGKSFSLGTDVVYAGIHQAGGDVHLKPRVEARNKRGRFISRGKAEKRKAKSTRITFAKGRVVTIPQRQMMPEGDIPGRWWAVFESEADAVSRGLFGE